MGTSGRFVAIHSHHHSHPWSNSYWPRKDAQCSSSCPFQPISSPVILQSPATTREDEPSQAIMRQSYLPTLVASLQCSLRRVGLLNDDLSATFHPIRSLFTWSDIQSSPYIRLQLGHCSSAATYVCSWVIVPAPQCLFPSTSAPFSDTPSRRLINAGTGCVG